MDIQVFEAETNEAIEAIVERITTEKLTASMMVPDETLSGRIRYNRWWSFVRGNAISGRGYSQDDSSATIASYLANPELKFSCEATVEFYVTLDSSPDEPDDDPAQVGDREPRTPTEALLVAIKEVRSSDWWFHQSTTSTYYQSDTVRAEGFPEVGRFGEDVSALVKLIPVVKRDKA